MGKLNILFLVCLGQNITYILQPSLTLVLFILNFLLFPKDIWILASICGFWLLKYFLWIIKLVTTIISMELRHLHWVWKIFLLFIFCFTPSQDFTIVVKQILKMKDRCLSSNSSLTLSRWPSDFDAEESIHELKQKCVIDLVGYIHIYAYIATYT